MIPFVAFTVGVAHAGDAPASDSAACSLTRGPVVVADAQAMVIKTTITTYSKKNHRPVQTHQAYRGCVLGSRRSFVLGNGESCSSTHCEPSISRLTLAGTTVAFERSATSAANPSVGFPGSGEWFVVVRNLRTGRTLHATPTGTPNPPAPGLTGNGETTALVVKPDGAVAWINNTSQASAHYEVHAVDRGGSHVLAVSSGIDRSSLALAGSTLYWTENGLPFSAPLS